LRRPSYQFSRPVVTTKKPRTESPIEELFDLQTRALKLPAPTREFRFHLVRKWRIDFAWPDLQLAVEIEGGIWTRGRHTRGAGVRADMEKYNALASMGWALLRFDGEAVKSGTAIKQVEQFISERK